MRRLLVGIGVVVITAAMVSLTPVAAQATSKTFTWAGGTGVKSWTVDKNWSPEGHPEDGDSVVIVGEPGNFTTITGIPAVSLKNLSISTANSNLQVGDGSGSITVNGHLDWTGGRLVSVLDIAAGATGTIQAPTSIDQPPAALAGVMTVHGSLTLNRPALAFGDHNDNHPDLWLVTQQQDAQQIGRRALLNIASGGHLSAPGDFIVNADKCCGDQPATLLNQGSVQVGGDFQVDHSMLDQRGTLTVGEDDTMSLAGGAARLGPDAAYAGAGTLSLDHLSSPLPDTTHLELNQGAAYLSGTNTLQDGFTLAVTDASALTGTGTFTGTGTVRLDDAWVYGEPTLTDHVSVQVSGTRHSEVAVWNPGLAGYHGQMTLGAGGKIDVGSFLDLDPGTTTNLTGGTFGVPAGATIGSPRCCEDGVELTNGPNATLAMGAGSSQPAVLNYVTFQNQGNLQILGATTFHAPRVVQTSGTTYIEDTTLDTTGHGLQLNGGNLTGEGKILGDVTNTAGKVAPNGNGLVITGDYVAGAAASLASRVLGKKPKAAQLRVTGTANLAGTLTTTTSGSPPLQSTTHAVTAGTVHGTFDCALTPGWLPQYDATGVSVLRTRVDAGACLRAMAPRTIISTTLRAGASRTASAPVPAAAKRMLLRVRTQAKTRTRTAIGIKVVGGGAATVKLSNTRSTVHFLLLRAGSLHRLTVHNAHGRAKVQVRLLSWS